MYLEQINYRLKAKYISDDIELTELIKDTAQKNKVILLVAPQGTGKSYLFQNTKIPHLIIAPTRALTNQYFATILRDRYGRTKSIPNTFHQSEQEVKQCIDDVDLLVIDEIHKAVQYSSFAYQQTETLLKAFDAFNHSGKPIILTTATPDILTCLEGFSLYDEIGATIVVKNNREYIKEVRIMEKYSNNKVEDFIRERYRQNNNSMQVVLINDTAKVESLAKILSDEGIKSIGITSQNREQDSEQLNVFRQLTQNKEIDYNVLLATSWVDVGINFVNENITDIYCMYDNEYSRGDLTLIWQLMARARKCKPILYITKPVLTVREKWLIESAVLNLGLTNEEVIDELKNKFDNGSNSKVYSYLYDLFCNTANEAIENYYKGIILEASVKPMIGIYSDQSYPYNPKFSPIPVKYFLYRMIEKIAFSNDQIKDKTNCCKIRQCKSDNPYYELCSIEEVGRIKDYLTKLAFKKEEFTTSEQIEQLNNISNGKLRLTTQLKPYIKKCELDLRLVKTKTVRGTRRFNLFFDYTINEVCLCCDNYGVGFSHYGYAKYSKESMLKIKELAPEIEILASGNGDEYFINISCLDDFKTLTDRKDLYFELMEHNR